MSTVYCITMFFWFHALFGFGLHSVNPLTENRELGHVGIKAPRAHAAHATATHRTHPTHASASTSTRAGTTVPGHAAPHTAHATHHLHGSLGDFVRSPY